MNRTVRLLPVARNVITRGYADKSKEKVVEVVSKEFGKMKEIQKKFQVDDGMPVYIKLGARDKILFQATAASVVGGVIWGLYEMVGFMIPQ